MRYIVIQAPAGYVVRDAATLEPTDYPGFGWDRAAADSAAARLNARDDREPQGEAVRLFTPAPNQIPGQTSMRPGQFYCRYCDTPEAMPGHEC